jgi:hypothetical protein
MENQSQSVDKHVGTCHCGAVRYAVEVDPATGGRCNCSVCTKIGGIGAIVKPRAFALLAGEDSLSVYAWGPKISRRFFCKTCGVHCFSRGFLAELGGDFVGVNLNTLDDVDMLANGKVVYWDGRHDNWTGGTRSQPWPIFSAA